MEKRRLSGAAAATLVAVTHPRSAGAHAADQGFVLLLPTEVYITAGTLAVALTILLLSLLRPGRLDALFRASGAERTDAPVPLWAALSATAVFAALIVIGRVGPTDPQANLLPLTLWTLWWMALFMVQALVFDVWRWIDPFPGLHRLVFGDRAAPFDLPKALSVWPAVVIFAVFMWYVLADTAPHDPRRLAWVAAGYWAFTMFGMTLFGREAWLRQVESFGVLFALIGRLRPVGPSGRIGLPGWQLDARRLDASHAAFALVLLAAGSFDGLYETFWWLGQVGVNPLEYPGRSAVMASTTAGLYGSIALLTFVFTGAVWIGIRLAACPSPLRDAFTPFALTLLPIAVGYHFAHYLVSFLVQVQVVAVALGDPLGRGWSLLGLHDMTVRVGFLTVPATVRVIWLTQAGAVVLSHIVAVLLCHRTAERMCSTRRDVLLVQLGLSVLMVAYTVFGLWLLASPRGV